MYSMNFTFVNGNPTDSFYASIDSLGFYLVGVPKDKIAQACNCDEIPSQGIYFLVNTKESKFEKRYLYIGQTKDGPSRLIDHKAKKAEWDVAYMFLAGKSVFPLQTVDELEALEIEKYKQCEAYNLINKKPNKANPDAKTQHIVDIIDDVMTFLGYSSTEKIYSKDESKEAKKENKILIDSNSLFIDTKEELMGKTPFFCTFRNKEFDLTSKEYSKYRSYKGLIRLVLDELKVDHYDVIKVLAENKTNYGKKGKKPTFTTNKADLNMAIEFDKGIYIESCFNNGQIMQVLDFIFRKCGIDYKEFTFKVR